MNFAVFSNTHHIGRILFVAGLMFLAACSGGKGSEEKLRILGKPPVQAYLGVEYKYDFGIAGGSGIPTVSLTNAPRWLSAEYVDNAARKGVVLRGVPGLSGGGAGDADLVDGAPLEVSLNVYDGDNATSITFPLLVSPNQLWLGSVEVTEGEKNEAPSGDDGEPLTDCMVAAPGELGSSDLIAYVPVYLLSPSVQRVVASFETRQVSAANAAHPGEDYLEHKGQLTIPPGTTLCYIQVIILDDELAEGTERLDLRITSVDEGLTFLNSTNSLTATITIHDNEPQVSWNKADVVVTEGAEVIVKGILDKAVDRLVSAEFELVSGDVEQVPIDEQELVVRVDGNTISAPYHIDFQPGETEKEIVIQVLPNPDQVAGPDKQFGLVWKRTQTVLETVDPLKVYVNELLTPITIPLPEGVWVREMLTDSQSNVYVAYSGSEPGQEGIVEIFDRHGKPLISPVIFAGGESPDKRRELADIFIREYEANAGDNQRERHVDLFMIGTVEENIAGHQGGADVLIDVWRREGDKNFEQVSPWPRQLGTPYDDVGHAIYVDDSNGIYVVGETKGQFKGGIATGGGDAFLAKYNMLGEQLFVNNISGLESREVLKDIAGNGISRITVTGYAVGELYGKAQGGKDVAIASYNREGRIQRGRQQGNMEDNVATTVALMNNRIVNGGYTQGLIFKGSGVHSGGEDAFISFFRDASTHGSTVQFGSAGDDRVLDVVTDGNMVFATGYASGPLFPGCTFAGGKNGFLVAYEAVPTSDDVNRKDEVLIPAWKGEGCPAAGQEGWPIQVGTSGNEQGSVLAITPSRKLLWLMERDEADGRTVEIIPYGLEGRSLLP